MKKYDQRNNYERVERKWRIIARNTCFEDMVNILRMFALSDKDIAVKSRINFKKQRVYSVSAYLSNEEYTMICQ